MEPALATIVWFAGDFAPRNWALCSGQILSIAQNQALFSLLGTTYGGDGRTTFALPNFNSRAAIGTGFGAGLSSHQLGQMGGAETATMNAATMPNHTHTMAAQVSVSSTAGTTDEADQSVLAVTGSNNFAPADAANGALGGVTIADAPAGAGQPFAIRQPYLALNFIICTAGIFPSRN